jgi:hypothetical protein
MTVAYESANPYPANVVRIVVRLASGTGVKDSLTRWCRNDV